MLDEIWSSLDLDPTLHSMCVDTKTEKMHVHVTLLNKKSYTLIENDLT